MKRKGLILVGALSMLALASCGNTNYRNVKEDDTFYCCNYSKEDDTAYVSVYNYKSFTDVYFSYESIIRGKYNLKEDFSNYVEKDYVINNNNFTFNGSITDTLLKYSSEKHRLKYRVVGEIKVSYNDTKYTISKTYKNIEFISMMFRDAYLSVEKIPYKNIFIDDK